MAIAYNFTDRYIINEGGKQFLMRGQNGSIIVYWIAYRVPDLTGSQSGISGLTNIVVMKEMR
jgi:hypothetical protein